MSNWRNCISQSVGSERISDVNEYVSISSASQKSPIDEFYNELKDILTLFPHNVWGHNSWTGSLASIAIISSVENYYRQVFSRILKICVDSKKNAANNSVNLGSVIWHPLNEVERGAFEHISLASSENINNTSKKYIGIDLRKSGLKIILEEFDKICELRHGIVHSGNVVAGKNGIKLQLESNSNITKVNIGFDQFQKVMSVCNALVVDSNQIFFEEIIRRWATSWRNAPGWDSSEESSKFKEIWQTFFSRRDLENGTIPENMTWVKCKNRVVREFNI